MSLWLMVWNVAHGALGPPPGASLSLRMQLPEAGGEIVPAAPVTVDVTPKSANGGWLGTWETAAQTAA